MRQTLGEGNRRRVGGRSAVMLWLTVLPFVVAASPSDPPLDPVPAVCPALGGSAPRIAGLQTGQAVVTGGTTTLQFSSDVRACGEWSKEVNGGDCLGHWTFHLTIPTEALVPGLHRLAKIDAEFGDLFVTTSPGANEGCSHACDTSVKGVGSVVISGRTIAGMVIDSVDDGCITGSFIALYDPTFVDAPDFNGAFFAVRCAP